MRAGVSEAGDDVVSRDFLFTWKPERGWPHRDLRKLVETFQSTGTAKQRWRCKAHKKIRLGDRAYLLKQGKPIGIFGRGTVIGKPERNAKTISGQNPWQVLIGYEVSRGDVLWDPEDRFLVDKVTCWTCQHRRRNGKMRPPGSHCGERQPAGSTA